MHFISIDPYIIVIIIKIIIRERERESETCMVIYVTHSFWIRQKCEVITQSNRKPLEIKMPTQNGYGECV